MVSNPFTYILLRWCLFLEATGICNGAYVIASIYRKIFGYKRDEVYIGTAYDREAKRKKDDLNKLKTGAGHMIKLPIDLGRKEMSLEEVDAVLAALQQHEDEVQDRIKEMTAKRNVLAQLDKEQRDVDARIQEISQRRSQVLNQTDVENARLETASSSEYEA
jgi:chromosome segregation ATPase